MKLDRRGFLGAAAAAALPMPSIAQGAPKVVVIGGGFGGASVARQLRRLDPAIQVTLVEPNARFITCPFSNEAVVGLRDLDSLTFSYAGVVKAGVTMVQDSAAAVDPDRREVTLATGGKLAYDRLVLAPGIQLRWNAIEGYDEAASALMPHAWAAGPQTLLLRRRLQEMPDGGTVIIAVPDNPYRCPPGPYERASLIAWFLQKNKPRAKLLILDAKEKFSKQPLFQEAWDTLYPGIVKWVPGSQSGRVVRVDAKAGKVFTEFDEYAPAVANIIPPQKAGQLAIDLGLDAGKGYCAVEPASFESRVRPGIHLVGDAIIAGAMPKSAFSANSQGKVCAAAIVALLRSKPVAEPILLNTCYSVAGPDYGFTIAGVFHPTAEGLTEIEGSGGISPLKAPPEVRRQEALYAESWYATITSEIFG